MGGLLGARPMRPALGDRAGHLGDAPRPGGAAEAGPDQIDRLVGAAVWADLDRGIELLEAADRERRVVAVELHAATSESPVVPT